MSKLYFVTGTTSDHPIILADYITADNLFPNMPVTSMVVNGAFHAVTTDAKRFAFDALNSGDFLATEATIDSTKIILRELARLELDETHWIPSSYITSAKAFVELVLDNLLDVE